MQTEQSFPRARAAAETEPVYGIVILPPRAERGVAKVPRPRMMAGDPSELDRG
ncbi:MAG TPA: hypothetical protein VF613_04770 [Longimicrobium sp.]|jgi:hypothetical protein